MKNTTKVAHDALMNYFKGVSKDLSRFSEKLKDVCKKIENDTNSKNTSYKVGDLIFFQYSSKQCEYFSDRIFCMTIESIHNFKGKNYYFGKVNTQQENGEFIKLIHIVSEDLVLITE